jgi:HAD superfamily phosphatase (TIGR01668 family)
LLKQSGYKLLVCDLDNTLSPHFTKFPTRKVIEFCKEVQKVGLKLAIVSNNSKKRVLSFTARLKPDAVIASAMKPMKHKIVRMMNAFDATPEETLFIGDQFITDI